MELKDFVKKVIVDLDKAISEANSETNREVRFKDVRGARTVLEFDVAVTVESVDSVTGKGGIKVWGIAEAEADGSAQNKNSTVSRVSFGVDISKITKQEKVESVELDNEIFSDSNRLRDV